MKLLANNPKVPKWWNKRIPTETDFYRECRRHKIKVFHLPLEVPGFYMACHGMRGIYLDFRLRGFKFLLIAFHELAHALFHAPPGTSASFYMVTPDTKNEFEAEAFAVCALIPEPLLRRMLAGEIEEECGFGRDVLEFRLRVLDIYEF